VTKRLDGRQLDALFDPANYAGSAGSFVDAVLDAFRATQTHQESKRT
jgi:adenylosuccinate lyase